MTERSLSDEAAAILDQALRQTDPISRMMLIEQALKLHREAIETAERDPDHPEPTPKDAGRNGAKRV